MSTRCLTASEWPLMNAREQLNAVAIWLGWQDEHLSFGLVNSLDALRLYEFAQSNPNLPEMADEWTSSQRVKALGYDPLELPEASKGREVSKTGACEAWDALHSARALVDSVAYVATEGDSAPVIAAIDAVIARPTPSKRKGR